MSKCITDSYVVDCSNLKESELDALFDYISSMGASKEKELLTRLYNSYIGYTHVGTISECETNKEWLSLSINDIMKEFNFMIKSFRSEVDILRKQYEKDAVSDDTPKKKRGRHRKEN